MKQMATNELGLILEHTTKWKGRWYDRRKVHYYDYKWEIEARGMEFGLYDRYRRFIKAHKIRFDE